MGGCPITSWLSHASVGFLSTKSTAPNLGKRKTCTTVVLPRLQAFTLICSMQLTMEPAWTQTSGSEWKCRAHSSHFWSSASLMQHQRTRLLERELPGQQEDMMVTGGGALEHFSRPSPPPFRWACSHLRVPSPAGEPHNPDQGRG